MVFHWSLINNKSPRVSSILANLNIPFVWFVTSRPLISKPFIFFYPSFGDCTMSNIYNWYNRHFHVPQFFQFPSKVQVLILLFAFFQLYSMVSRNSKVHNSASFIIIIIIIIKLISSFTPALADGLLPESEWLQVSSGLQDSSQYCGQLLLLLNRDNYLKPYCVWVGGDVPWCSG